MASNILNYDYYEEFKNYIDLINMIPKAPPTPSFPGIQGALGQGVVSGIGTPIPMMTSTTGMSVQASPDYLLKMLHMRMRVAEGNRLPFDFIAPYKNGDTVVVFFVHDKNPTYVEDSWDLYPSDALVTKLRMILG